MLAMSPFCPTLGWDYPLELETNHVFDNFALDSSFFPDFLPCQLDQDYQDNNQESNHAKRSESPQGFPNFLPCQLAQDYQDNNQESNHAKRSESPQGTSSIDHSDHNPILAKKLDHNASERDRRKKINSMYASLRNLLPSIDQRKKLSIPATVTRVLEYIPELQKEVENLNHKKDVILSRISTQQGNTSECMTMKETASYSITINKVDEKEMVIQISALERISISEILLLLEKNGHFIFDVSCFLSFGGRTFYNLHLWMDGSHNVNCEVLLSILQKQNQMQIYS